MNGLKQLVGVGLVALAGVCSAAPEWVLNHGPDAVRAVATQATGGCECGLFRVTATGADTTLTLPMARDDAFAAASHAFFALRYQVVSSIRTAGIFFTTDTLTTLCDKSYSPFPIEPDGAWHDLIVDMRTFAHKQWKGTITSFRLDPANPSAPGDGYAVSRLGFFPTREAAAAFLAQADDRPDYAQELILDGPDCRVLIPANTLADGWRREDFLLHGDSPAGRTESSGQNADGGKGGTKGVTVCCDGEPVPCHVTSRGFAFYVAGKPGRYARAGNVPADQMKPLDDATAQRFGCRPAPTPPGAFSPEPRIRIGGWGIFRDADWNRARVEDFAACGFDLLIASPADSSFGGRLLTACDALGVEVYLDEAVARVAPARAGREYADHPAYAGAYLTDEPGTDAYPRWGRIARNYQAATGKVPFINLLPMYANAAQLKYGAGAAAIEYYDADPDLYRKYCTRYCDEVPTDYICTDIYPLNWTKGARTTYSAYVESINVIATVARERRREFWCCIQTFGWTKDKRTPNAAEFRWQCHSLLAFGCRGILCWVYGAYNDAFPSLTTCSGERTPAWYDARTVFAEVRRLSPVYCRYANLGAFTHNCTAKTPYLKMSGEYRDFATIRRMECPDPLLVGCFKANEGKGTAFSLVNMIELGEGRSTIARVDLGGRAATVYRGGHPESSSPDRDGFHWIPLASGEGVFVTVAGEP